MLGLRLEFDGERLRFWDPVGERYLRTPLESEQDAIRGEHREQERLAIIADLRTGSNPPSGSEG